MNPLPLPDSNNSEAEIGDQMEVSQVDEVNAERLASRNMDVSSSSLVEEDKMDVSWDKGSMCSSQALGEPKECLIVEETGRDATQVCHFTPIICIIIL